MGRPAYNPGALMSVKAVAIKASVSEKTVRRAIADKKIAVTHLGNALRISEAAYADWVRRNTIDPVL